MKHFWLIIWAVFLTFVVTRVYLHPQFPYTHDGENHLARFANYKVAVREGQIPPRFAPNLMNRYGYPVFNYNYPLANILSVPLSLLKVSYEVTLKVMVIVSVFASLMGVAVWVRQLGYRSHEPVLTMAVYGLSHYLVSTIMYRGNIGEILAYGLLPWVMVSLEWSIRRHPAALLSIPIWSAFALSHTVTVFLASLVFIPIAVARIQTQWSVWCRVCLFGAITVALVAWFWLPAIGEKDQIVLGSDDLAQQYAQHAVALRQVLWSPLEFGFSYAAPIDTLSVGIGWLIAVILFLGTLIFFLTHVLPNNTPHFPKWWWSGVLLLVLFQLQIMMPIWSLIPFGNFIQFPWRLGMFVPFCVVPIAAWIWHHTPSVRWLLVCVGGMSILQILQLQPVDRFTKLNRDYDAFSQSTSTANENRVQTFTYTNIADWQPTPTVLGDAAVRVLFWNGSVREYVVNARDTAVVIEPTMYFLGWKTCVWRDGRCQTLKYDALKSAEGRIAFSLIEGEHHIRTQFTQDTPLRLIGHLLFVCGVGASMMLIWNICRRKHFFFL